MEWAIESNSANILTHLRQLGYAIPSSLVVKYQEVLAEYLHSEYPLKVRAGWPSLPSSPPSLPLFLPLPLSLPTSPFLPPTSPSLPSSLPFSLGWIWEYMTK